MGMSRRADQTVSTGPGFLKSVAAYALGDFSLCLAWNGIAAYLLATWIQSGVPAVAAGAVMFGGQLLTVLSDLFVGGASDLAHQRGVRYSTWVGWSAIPIDEGLVATFVIPHYCEGIVRLFLAASVYGVFLFAYSCGSIPYSSMLKVLTSDPRKRVQYGSWGMAAAFVGAFAVTVGFPPLLELTSSVFASIACIAVMMTVGLICTSLGVGSLERFPATGKKIPYRGLLLAFFRDRSFARLFGTAVLFCAANSARFGALAIFVKETSGSALTCSAGFACLTLASAVGAASVSVLSRYAGLRALLAVSAVCAAVASIVFFFAGRSDFASLMEFLMVAEVFSGVMPAVCRILVASYADRFGDAVAGRVYAVWGLTGKIGNGLGALAVAICFAAAPGVKGASCAISIVPAMLLALVAILAARGGPKDVC